MTAVDLDDGAFDASDSAPPSAPRHQGELPLAFPGGAGAGDDTPAHLPARMVNEFVYCPRLAWLEYVESEWADNADTTEGRTVHRVADRPKGDLPDAADREAEEPIHARSITLASDSLGVVARIDVVEGTAGALRPVDYKRGKRPHVERAAYQPERVQVALQVLLLREHGHASGEGILYFAGSRERVPVEVDAGLEAETRAAVHGMRLMLGQGRIPPPLVDSPKCPRCSLVGICLPDEVAWLKGRRIEPRPLAAARIEAVPLVIQDHRARIGKDGDTLTVTVDGENLARARLADVSQVAVFGNAYLTTPALHELMRREIPVTWMSYGGWFLGHTVGLGHRNVARRLDQWRQSFDPAFCLRLARGLVDAKIRNCRTLVRRNWRGADGPAAVLGRLDRARREAETARDLSTLLGIEGTAARLYFEAFAACFSDTVGATGRFDWNGRNRRPPADPVNALLSFVYGMLARVWTVQLSAIGLDPYRGFFHQPHYGRPALALDMMEPYRPLIADSVVLLALNNAEVAAGDFIERAGSVALTPSGRKAIIATFERRLDQEITHPLFGYRISYRRLFEVQARLLARHLGGEIAELPHITPR